MLELFGQPNTEHHPSQLYLEDAPLGITKLDPRIGVNVV